MLFLKPTLTADVLGEANIMSGFTYDLWGSQYNADCTGNAFSGCLRSSGGGSIINPIQSARIRTAESFSFRYGRVEVVAKLPRGDWVRSFFCFVTVVYTSSCVRLPAIRLPIAFLHSFGPPFGCCQPIISTGSGLPVERSI